MGLTGVLSLLLGSGACAHASAALGGGHWVSRGIAVRGGADGAPAGHWVSRGLAVRGGAEPVPEGGDEESAGLPEGVLTEEELSKTSLKELLGETLLTVEDAETGAVKEVPASEALEGKYLAMYFMSKGVEDQLAEKLAGVTQEGQTAMLPTAYIKEMYAKAKADGHKLEIVYVGLDNEEDFKEHFKGMPWLAIPHSKAASANLARKLEVFTVPRVVVLDEQHEVVTKAGFTNMVHFPDDFPWKDKALKELLGDTFDKADGTTVGSEALDGKTLAVYFSADWCTPCKNFMPKLTQAYNKLQAAGKPFEVVFVSNDKTDEEYQKFHKSMPWLSVPYSSERRATIINLLGVRALPTLLVFGEDGKVITTDGVKAVVRDPEAENFPWQPKPVEELSESPEVVMQKPSLVVFMEAVEKEEQDKVTATLTSIAEARVKKAEGGDKVRRLGFLAANAIDNFSTTFRTLVGLEEIQGKFKFMKSKKAMLRPKLALMDLMGGKFAISDAEEVTQESVEAFLAQWEAGELEMQEVNIPADAAKEDGEDDA